MTKSSSPSKKRNRLRRRHSRLWNIFTVLITLFLIQIFSSFLLLPKLHEPNEERLSSDEKTGSNHIFVDLSDPPRLPRLTEQQCPMAILRNKKGWQKLLIKGAAKQANLSPVVNTEDKECTKQSKTLLQTPAPSSKKLTFLLLYYNDYKFLEQQLKTWHEFSNQTLSDMQFIIIDDGSAPGKRAVEFIHINQDYGKSSLMDITIYEIDQDLAWNIGGARNLGFFLSNTEWIFMNDADILLAPDTMDYVMELANSPIAREAEVNKNQLPVMFSFFQRRGKYEEDLNKLDPHVAVLLIQRQSYWNALGCDEDFVGRYGGTDRHFRQRGTSQQKAFEMIKVHEEQDERKISPLHQMSDADTKTCPTNMRCLKPEPTKTKNEMKTSKDPTVNRVLLKQKLKRHVPWSDKYLRFTWRKVYQKPSE